MKKLTITMLVLLAASTMFAGEKIEERREKHQERREQTYEKMQERFKDKPKVLAILEKYRKKHQELREQMKKELQALKESVEKKNSGAVTETD